jgi:hypothetical protein
MERDEFGRFVKGHKGLSGDSNPMKNPEIAKKVSETKKRHFGEGKKFGCYNYWLRKKRSKETIEKIRETKRLQHQDPNSIYNSKEWNERRIENSIKRIKELWQNPEFRKRQIEERLERWKNKEYKEKAIKKILKSMFKRPTYLEIKFLDFIKRNNVPLIYCGDGSLLIGGKNPDFVESNGKKICVEVGNKFEKSIKRGGRNYQSWQEYEKQRIEHFAKCGWKCLVIWEDELEDEQNLLEKIKVFMNEEK